MLSRLNKANVARWCARVSALVVLVVLLWANAWAQDAKPEVLVIGGWVNAAEGKASYQRGAAAYALNSDVRLQSGDLISTGQDGRVEVLLNPGYYLRLAGQSACRLLDTNVDNLKLQLDAGTLALEVLRHDAYGIGNIPERLSYELITIVTPDTEIAIRVGGSYRINVAADGRSELQVRAGEAVVGHTRVKEKQAAGAADGAATVRAFDPKVEDPFDVWCRTRAQALVAANRALKEVDWRKAQRKGADVTLAMPALKEQESSPFVLSAVPGTVSFVEADVQVGRAGADWQLLAAGAALKAGQTLRTGAHSRAEVLLLPDVYLRLGGASEIVFDELSFDAVALKLVRGSAILDAFKFEPKRAAHLTLAGPVSNMTVLGAGNYRLDSRQGGEEISVRQGRVALAGQTIDACRHLVAGRSTPCAADEEDSFDLWSEERRKGTGVGTWPNVARFLALLKRDRVVWTGFWCRGPQMAGYTFVPYQNLGFRTPFGGKYALYFLQWRPSFLSPQGNPYERNLQLPTRVFIRLPGRP
ncbi:MAG TPA: FecR domain-containing protein [Pyrinomonadaceae bacterium]